jgi:hypothetical protein
LSNAVTLNGVSYLIPDTGEGGWGDAVTNYLVALSTGVLQKAGGTFTLTASVDFGANFGLRAQYYQTRGASLASTGEFRLSNAETIQWRNAADSANLPLTVNASDILEFNGNPLTSLAIGAADTVLRINTGGTAAEYALLSNANIAASGTADIALNKLVATTASRALETDGSGFIVASATTAAEIALLSGVSALIDNPLTTRGDIIARGASTPDRLAIGAANTVLNTDGTDPAWALIANANIAASGAADIALNKLVATTASRALETDGSGFIVASATTSTELALLSGVSAIIDDPLTTRGDIIARGASTPDRLAIGAADTFLYSDGTDPAWQSFVTKLLATQAIGNLTSTGLLTGGSVTQDADPAKYDVAAGTGVVVDNYTDPASPTYAAVSWSALNAQTLPNIATQTVTYIGMDSGGSISEIDWSNRNTELRDKILLGSISHPDGSTIAGISDEGLNLAFDTPLGLTDMSIAIGPINESGNVYSANGANLNINKSSGIVFAIAANIKNSNKNPNRLTVASETASNFFYTYQDGVGGFTVSALTTAIVPGSYDDGDGTLGSVSNNNWSVHRIFTTIALTVVQYGQATYSTQSGALDGIQTEDFSLNPDLDGALLRSYLIVKGNATDLSSSSEAQFVAAGKFGGAGANGGSSSTTDMQQAYDNSSIPQIVVDATNGAMIIEDASTPIAAPLFQVRANGGAGDDFFAIDADGVYVGASHDTSAAIDITSTTQGLGLPNMTSTQRDAISSPKTGLKIWNTTTSAENVYDGSAWAATGGTGSGSGEINYITNGDAETDTTGWATYDDGASAVPVNGTGGSSSTLTLTAQGTTILRGTQSFKLAHSAADGQGEGVSYDFTIDAADKNKLLKLAFDYNTDAAYVNEDIKVYVYDVTNTTLITPSDNGIIGVDKDDNSSGSRTIGWASTDSVSYRLIFHLTTTNASAYDLYFDNVIVGPGSVATGAVITAWEAYTPTDSGGGFGTLASVNMQWRRVGENVEIQGYLTTGTVAASEVQITMPQGYIVDFIGSADTVQVGTLTMDSATADDPSPVIATNGDAYLNLGRFNISANLEPLVPADGNGSWTTAARVSINAIVPVSAFKGAGTVNLMSDNVVSASARAYYSLTGDIAVGDGVIGAVYTIETANEGNGFTTTSTSRVTANFTGWATISGNLYTTTIPTTHIWDFDINGSLFTSLKGTTTPYMPFSWTIPVTIGDYFEFQCQTGGGVTLDASNGNNITFARSQDFSAGQPVAFGFANATDYGLVKLPHYLKKTSDTSGVTISVNADPFSTALDFAGLLDGRTYRITSVVGLRSNNNTEAGLAWYVDSRTPGTAIGYVRSISNVTTGTDTTYITCVDIFTKSGNGTLLASWQGVANANAGLDSTSTEPHIAILEDITDLYGTTVLT